jgi:hypothetical protein
MPNFVIHPTTFIHLQIFVKFVRIFNRSEHIADNPGWLGLFTLNLSVDLSSSMLFKLQADQALALRII